MMMMISNKLAKNSKQRNCKRYNFESNFDFLNCWVNGQKRRDISFLTA